ncbi:LLM class flavin-dependent oxidoreductase [Tessaracoccus antarcticus]|uniref:LLM class flavin-dependent oxidoreductase n=1 Tax=Tessaracoccus antarcticus TaxID=2479848 RepID=A0A3M0G3P7_9ACTN|nr:LLM class flavin-dependent oxidoreductase [Tessaracoccus antarcticus]RMB58747.1 LLM class flavin-dependent oxidoreductase [Tessaracoccus antarcticus]
MTSNPIAPHVPLSILDLVSVSSGQSIGEAIEASMHSVEVAERVGYSRVWFAEHHNTAAVASSSTAVIVGRAAARTTRIIVGSGGVMLPNHAPLMVAEDYGTLAAMFPGRVELGLGRAPGTDQITARALARSDGSPNAFVANVTDLYDWTTSGVASSGLRAGVAAGTQVPMWILGSSTSGAQIAAHLGLPYAFASHFAPDALLPAIELYRERFNPDAPTAQIEEPRVMVGVNVLAAEDDAEAHHQFSTVQRMFMSLRRSGGREALLPPGEVEATEQELAMMEHMLQVSAIGSPDRVVSQLESLVDLTDADELVTVTYAHDPAVRSRSLELVAQAWGLQA